MESARIGHLAYNTDVFLRQRAAEGSDKRELLVGITRGNPAANEQLLNMYKRKFALISQNKIVGSLLARFASTESTDVFKNAYLLGDMQVPFYTLNHARPLLHFTSSEEQKGKELLAQLSIDDRSWFACFHSRDGAYLSKRFPQFDYSYHDFRDSDVKNYLDAAKYIASCGGYAVRMGHMVGEELPDLHEPRIIDYASRFRSDFGDIYLPSKAKFFLGNTSGMFIVSVIFGVPVALANFIPLSHQTLRKCDLFIPKKVLSVRSDRLLTFREMLELDDDSYTTEGLARAGLTVVENTGQEILDLAREMNERLDGTFVYTKEDEDLQRAFHAVFQPHHRCYRTPVRIGTKFLREHRDLLA